MQYLNNVSRPFDGQLRSVPSSRRESSRRVLNPKIGAALLLSALVNFSGTVAVYPAPAAAMPLIPTTGIGEVARPSGKTELPQLAVRIASGAGADELIRFDGSSSWNEDIAANQWGAARIGSDGSSTLSERRAAAAEDTALVLLASNEGAPDSANGEPAPQFAAVGAAAPVVPELSIVATSAGAQSEGSGPVLFTISSNMKPTAPLKIVYTPSEVSGGDFLTDEVAQATTHPGLILRSDGRGRFVNHLSIPIHDDNLDEADGSISVALSLNTEESGTYTVHATNGSAEKQIADDDVPELSIADAAIVSESAGSAGFTVTASIAPKSALAIRYRVANLRGDFLPSSSLNRILTTSPALVFSDDGKGDQTSTLTVNLDDDGVSEINGQVRITLESDNSPAAYTVADAAGSATVRITDDDSTLPVLSVDDVDFVVESTGQVKFIVTSNINPNGMLTVRYTQAEVGSGDFLASSEERAKDAMLNFDRTTDTDPYTAEITVPLDNDGTDEATGEIRITLNDDPADTHSYNVHSGEGASATATVFDDDAPVISIGDAAAVAEIAGRVRFPITARVQPRAPLNILYTPAEVGGGDFLPNTFEREITHAGLTLSADGNGKFAGYLEIPLRHDVAYTGTGSISVTLNPDSATPQKYKLHATSNSATARIIDNELPVLSIAPTQPSVVENSGTVPFTITASRRPVGNLKVRYTPAEVNNGDYLTDSVATVTTHAGLAFTENAQGAYTATIEIPLQDNNLDQVSGAISVSLNLNTDESGTYTVHQTNNTATVAITDDDFPELSIIAKQSSFAENEGPAVFIVTADVMPVSPLQVWYRPRSYSGYYLSPDDNLLKKHTGLTFSENDAGEYTAELQVGLIDDYYVEDESGEIEVILRLNTENPGTYSVDSDNGIARTVITDNDHTPTLAVKRDGLAYEVKGFAPFVVSTRAIQNRDVTVRYRVENVSGNFLPAASLNKILTKPLELRKFRDTLIYSDGLRVDLDDDRIAELAGSIRITLVEDTMDPPTYWVDANNSSATVTVIDDDTPRNISLSLADVDDEVTENQGHGLNESGEPVLRFAVTATVNPGRPLNVNYYVRNLSSSRSFITTQVAGNRSKMLTFTQTDTDSPFFAHIEIPLDNDSLPDRSGFVEFRLNYGSDYQITGSTTVRVEVHDDDLPEISIGNAAAVAENAGPVRFPITSRVNPANPLRIRYTPYPVSGNFLPDNIRNQIHPGLEFEETDNGTYVGYIEIPLRSNSDEPMNGSIRVSIYEESVADNQKTYIIADNSSRATATIYVDIPVLSIAPVQASYGEYEGPAMFKVSSPVVPPEPFTLHYTPAEVGAGDFLTDATAQKQEVANYTLTRDDSGQYVGTLAVPLDDDDFGEVAGSISVTLQPSEVDPPIYVVHGTNFSATVNVTDDDLPTLSISAESATVLESSGTAIFTVVSSKPPGSAFKVRYTPAEVDGGDFLTNTVAVETTHPGLTFREIAGVYTASLFIPIDNDGVDEANGSISVALGLNTDDPGTYSIHATDHTATVNIIDDDVPQLSIANATALAEDDGPAEFTVSLDIAPKADLAVRYRLANVTGDFAPDANLDRILTANPPLAFTSDGQGGFVSTLNVAIDNDLIPEINGEMRVTVVADLSPETYTVVDANKSATVKVADDDALVPVLSIADVDAVGESAGFVDFTVTASGDPRRPVTVSFTPAEVAGGDFLTDMVAQEAKTTLNFTRSSPTDPYTDEITVALHNDDVGEDTGTIRVTLNTDPATPATYTLAAGQGATATATVYDDDLPIISIANAAAVAENAGPARFVISALAQPRQALRINYTPSEIAGGDFLTDAVAQATTHAGLTLVDNGAGLFTGFLDITLDNDNVDEADGSIMVTLNEDPLAVDTYKIKSGAGSATAAIADDDAPELTIVPTAATYAESTESASFTLTASIEPITALKVRYTAAEVAGGDFLKTVDESVKTHTGLTFSDNGSGVFTALLSIPLDNDEVDETDGSISVALSLNTDEPGTYTVHGTNGTATVGITDDDAPELSIAPTVATYAENSGPASFTITASISPIAALKVRYTPAEVSPGDFLTDTVATLTTHAGLSFSDNGSGVFTASLTIPLDNDEIDEADGSISVALSLNTDEPGTYTVSGTEGTATVAITDDDVPELSIAASTSTAAESTGVANFTITASIEPKAPLKVRYTPAEVASGDFLTDTVAASTTHAGLTFSKNSDDEFTGILAVNLHNDNVDEVDGSISVALSLNADEPGTYTVSGTNHTATVAITDDDVPVLSIANAAALDESSGPARFTVTASIEPVADLTVRYQVANARGDFLPATSLNKTLTTDPALNFTENDSGDFTSILQVALQADPDPEINGTVQVTLVADTAPITYTVADAAKQATVAVNDDDSLIPILSVEDVDVAAESDGTVEFTVISNIDPGRSLVVHFTPAEVDSGDFLTDMEVQKKMETLQFSRATSADPYTDEITVNLHDDEEGEVTGNIMVTLNDDPAIPATYLVAAGADGSATAVVYDDDTPEISIANAANVAENLGPARFVVSARVEPDAALRIRYTPSEVSGGDFLTDTVAQATTHTGLTLRDNGAGLFTGNLDIVLDNDDIDEADGSIMVTLNPDPQTTDTYKVKSSASSATAAIADDDVPELSIAATAATYAEDSGSASFTLTASIEPKAALKVRYTAAEVASGDFLKTVDEGAKTHTGLTFSNNGSGPYTAVLAIPLDNDDVDEADGSISVALSLNAAESGTYSVHGSNGTVTVAITDDDVPTLSIANATALSEDNGPAEFMITASIAPKADLAVRYTVENQTGNFLPAANLNRTLTASPALEFEADDNGNYVSTLNVALHDDTTAEINGTVKVTLVDDTSPATYAVNDSAKIATVDVRDDDAAVPELSIADVDFVAESSGSVDFTVTARIDPMRPITVSFTPAEVAGGNFLTNLTAQETKTTLNFSRSSTSDPFTDEITVALDNDGDDEATGSIMVALNADPATSATYTVAAGQGGSATATVYDDDAPEISIANAADLAENAGPANFTISARVQPRAALMIRYTPAEVSGGDFLTNAVAQATTHAGLTLTDNGAGLYTAVLPVALDNDGTDENDGSIQVMLNPDPQDPDTYKVHGTANIATAMVADDDVPELSIANAANVAEDGGPAEFTITASIAPKANLAVQYTVENVTGNFVPVANLNTTLTANPALQFQKDDNDNYIAILNVDLHNDTTPEINGSVRVTLQPDSSTATYSVQESAKSALVNVNDDDATVPVLSIADVDFVAESAGHVEFTVSASFDPGRMVRVSYTPAEVADGDFLTDLVAVQSFALLDFDQATPSDPYIDTITVNLHNDDDDEVTGSIMVTLNEDPETPVTYLVAADPHGSATATVYDDDAPEISIANAPAAAENAGPARFVVSARVQPRNALRINYTPAEVAGGDFLTDTVARATTHTGLTLSADGTGLFTGNLDIVLDDDDIDEVDGTIMVSLNADPQNPNTYKVKSSASSATAAISDNDVPELSIAAANATYQEDAGPAVFMITASIKPKSTLKVRYTPAEVAGGDFLTDETAVVTTHTGLVFSENSSGDYAAELEIPLHDDGVDEADGSIAVSLSLNTDEPGTYSVHGTNGSASAAITDDDVPALAIAAKNASYAENSGPAVFTITASIRPKSDLKVRYTPSEVASGDYLTDSVASLTTHGGLAFSENASGDFTADLEIPLHDDDLDEADGSIMVTLSLNSDEPGTYSVSDSDASATVGITDDDVPELSIATATESTRVAGNSGIVRFVITASVKPKEALKVRYVAIERMDNFVGIDSPPEETTHPGLSFAANDDNEFVVVLEVRLKNVYNFQDTGSLRVLLIPNSTDPGTYSVNTQENSSSVDIFSEDVPELSVTAESATVAENSGTAVFVVAASIEPKSALNVHYTPMEVAQGDFLKDETAKDSEISLTFMQNQENSEFTAKISVPLDDDGRSESTGMISLALKADPASPTSYTVATGDGGHASVTVLDDDAPVLTIAAGSEVSEANGAAMFIITAAVVPKGDITVRFTPAAGNGDFLGGSHQDGVAEDQILTFNGTTRATLEVAIDNDNLDEDDGSISVTLNEDLAAADKKYSIDSVQTATVNVLDDEELPLLTFAEGSLEMDEAAGVMEFVLNLSPVSGRQVRVDANTVSDNAVAGMDYQAVSEEVVFEAGTTTYKISVGIIDDFDHEESESVKVELTNIINARFANNETSVQKSGTITDNDPTPRIFITPDKKRIMEGETITFTVESSKIAETDLTVYLRAWQDGDFVIFPIPRFLIIAAGEREAEFKVPTYNDMQDTLPEGEYGNITVMVVDQDEYDQAVPSDEKSSVATVQIEDRGVPGPGDITTKYSVVGAVIEKILLQIPYTVPVEQEPTATTRLNEAEISISATRVSVNEGEVVEFQIAVKPEAKENLNVSLLLEDSGDFIGGRNSAVVSIAKGQSAGLLQIQTVDDEVAEQNGVITATVVAGSGYTVSNASSATVEIVDGDDRAELQIQVEEVLSEMLLSASANTLNAASSRFSHAFDGSASTTLALNGQKTPASWLKTHGESINSGSINWQSILDDSEFAVELFPEAENPSRATFWGNGSKREMLKIGSGEQVAMKGDEFTGHMGMDMRVGSGVLAGFAVAKTESNIEYGMVDAEKILYAANTTAVQPYLGFQSLNNTASMLFSVGYGFSELGIDQGSNYSANLNGQYHTIGFEGNTKLYSSDSFIPSGTTVIQLSGKTALAESFVDGLDGLLEKTHLQTGEFQLEIEGSHEQELVGIGTLSPSVYFGAKGEAKNGSSFISLETGAKSRFVSNFGLKIIGEGKMQFSNHDRIRQWGVSSSIEYDQQQDGLGILFDLSPAWGWTENSANESYYSSNHLKDELHSGQQVNGSKIELEIGYGLSALDGLATITPFTSLELTDGVGNVHQIGSRFGTGSNIKFELIGTREVRSGGEFEDTLKLKGNYEW